MKEKDFKSRLANLRNTLRDLSLILPKLHEGSEIIEFKTLFTRCCRLLFNKDDFYLYIWDEDALLHLQQLFQIKTPKQSVYCKQLKNLAERTSIVRRINDLFFSILDNKFSIEDVCERISNLSEPCDSLLLKLKASNRVQEVRSSNVPASEKIGSFIEHLVQDNGIDFSNFAEAIQRVIDSLKNNEGSGGVNALLVSNTNNVGIAVPIRILIREGRGEVKSLIPGSDYFEKAIERAKQALMDRRILSNSENVLYSLDITEAKYSGESIALPAAVAMYSAKTKIPIDSYTAFTGNINPDGEQFKIKRVNGISQKLEAAILNGCRRIFLPKENSAEVTDDHEKELEIHYVEDVTEVLLKLQKSIERIPGDSLQIKKINILRAYCSDQGWYISDPLPIENALQFTIAPPTPPELKIAIYNTGSHNPKKRDELHFQELLNDLGKIDLSLTAIRPINIKPFIIKDSELRSQIKETLDQLHPADQNEEQHCDYSYGFQNDKENIIVKQYSSGKLQLQGKGGELYKKILEIIVALYNSKYPTAKLEVGDYIKDEPEIETRFDKKIETFSLEEIPFPHIGTDESGKGDYFGPMVIAGVWLDESIKNRLEKIGIRDSKLVSDKRCKELASQIREICHRKYEEVEITPIKYNELYEEFKKERKNLNHLLAWGHARAIETILAKHDCKYAIADQFGDEKFIESKLMEKGKKIDLIQTTMGERYLAVAAASILARDRFLTRMENFSQEYGTELPKGASDAVIEAAKLIVDNKGREELKKVAKLHHKTTNKVLVGD